MIMTSTSARKPKQPRGQRLFRCACFSVRLWSLALVAAFAGASGSDANEENANDPPASPLRRWAIITSKEVQATGLSDLLTAKLSQLPGVELVERDELDKLRSEQQVAIFLGAQATGERIRLGRLLSADGLLMLDYITQKEGDNGAEQKFLKLVVSECRYGARLRVELLPLPKQGTREEAQRPPPAAEKPLPLPDEEARPARLPQLASEQPTDRLVDHCARVVLDTRKRWQGGIRQIVGVPHFVSKNLRTDYDYLQSAYAILLQQSLLAQPGVAVLEIEEVRAIARELDIEKRDYKNRPLMQFVAGDFEMSRREVDGPVTVRLSLTVSDGTKEQAIEHADVPFDQVAALFTGSVAEAILAPANGDRKSLPIERQVEILTSRANVFSELGAIQHAVPLWEAAVLLAPEDVDLRVRLIRETQSTFGFARQHSWPKQNADKEQHLSRLRFLERHVYPLIYRRKVPPVTAVYLARRLLDQIVATGDKLGKSPEYEKKYRDVYRDLFCQRIPKLDYDLPVDGKKHDRDGQIQDWVNSGANIAQGINPTTWDELFYFLDEVAPSDAPPNNALTMVLYGAWHCSRHPDEGKWSHTNLRAFFEKLARSKGTTNQLYGKYAVIGVRICQGEAVTRAMLDEARQLIADMKKLETRHFGQPSVWGGMSFYAEINTAGLIAAVGKNEPPVDQVKKRQRPVAKVADRRPARVPLKKRPKKNAKKKAKKNGNEQHAAVRRAEFQERPRGKHMHVEISRDVTLRPIDEPIVAEWNHWIRCNDSLDLMFSPKQVFAMQSKGEVNSVFKMDRSTGAIEDVHWSSKNVWIRTQRGGLHYCTLDGEEIYRADAKEGFPQAGKRSRQFYSMIALDDERLLVFGPEENSGGRAWLRLISPRETSAAKRVRVIYKFVKKIRPQHADQHDPAQQIDRLEFHPYVDPTKAKAKKIVAYRKSSSLRRRPLVIDTQTYEVSTLASDALPATNDKYQPPYFKLQSRRSLRLALYVANLQGASPVPNRYLRIPVEESGWGMLEEGGWVYCLNDGAMSRYHRHSRLLEELVQKERPTCYGRSAFYGLVAWNRGRQPQQLVMPPSDPLQSYLHIEEARRQPYFEAAAALRQTGGKLRMVVTDNSQTGTRVDLSGPFGLTGNVDGVLSQLQNIDDLLKVEMAYVDLPDDGLKHLAPLTGLTHLGLNRTTATDADLRHLRGLKKLEYLHLGSTRGGSEFSDAGLEQIGELKNLTTLALWGQKFTDASLEDLDRFPALRLLRLHDTSVSQAAIERLRQARPRLQIRRNLRTILP